MMTARARAISGTALLLTVVAAVSCERPEPPGQAMRYTGASISFLYPGNWSVEEESSSKREVIRVGTAHQYVFIFDIRTSASLTPTDLWEMFGRHRKTETEKKTILGEPVMTLGPVVEAEISRLIGGQDVAGVRYEYEMDYLGSPTVIHAESFVIQEDDRVVGIYTRADAERAAMVQPGFNMILDSLSLGAGS